MFRLSSLLLAGVFGLAASPQPPSMDGVWRSQGYGDLFVIEGTSLRAFEVTATTCVPGFTATLETTAIAGREATFRIAGGGTFFVRTGGTADHKVLHSDGSASDVRFDRLPRLPAVCEQPTPDTPMANFEVFSRTWAEHYISFDLKKTDWGKVVEANRPKVTAATSRDALFEIFEKMIAPFGDAHTSLSAPDLKRQVRNLRPGTDRVAKGDLGAFRSGGMAAVLAVTDHAYLDPPLRTFCNDQLQYGHVDATTGYLRILSFSGYAKEGGFAAGLTALEAALDAIFSDPALERLVIDVRINGGGADPYGLAIASRLATRECLAYTKEARADAVDRNKWTPGDPSWVRPSRRPAFRGPIVELIGPLTISAGETFTQALMGRTPRVTRIGEHTQGVFSDVLGRRLPNGWRFGLPNEVFRTPEGKTFDGDGIPPDVEVPVFADEDLAAGRDPAMAKALELLGVPAKPRPQGRAATGMIPVKGGELYYEEKGSGRAVVLLHAGMVDCRMWDGQFDLLAGRHRVVRFDARGLGRSSLPAGDYSNHEDLHDLLVALGIRKATLVGLSLGGRTAIDFALAYPDMVEAIVAVAPGMSGWEFKDPFLVERSRRLQPAIEQNDGAAFVDWFVESWVDGPRRTPTQVDRTVRERVRQMGTENLAKHGSLRQYLDRARRVQELGAAKRIGELKVPILAIVGDQDMTDIHDIVDALVKTVPGSKKVLVPGAGHMVNMEKAEEFNRLLVDFLSGK